MSTLLTCRSASARPYSRGLKADANSLLQILEVERYELSLMLVSDRAIRKLNRDFRAKDQATDVLSFPQFDEDLDPAAIAHTDATDAPPMVLGDIVISIATASRQARELRQNVAARIRTLLIHGVLHLMGYDHERSASEARRMFKREHELAALLEKADKRASGSPQGKAATTKITRESLWSPAAMPERSVKPAKKSAASRASRRLAVPRNS
jgi:probable rRNA maturation factor